MLFSSLLSKKQLILAVGCASLMLMGLGCSSPTDVPGAASPASSSSTTVSADSSGNGLCDHPYYPLRPGYSVKYANTYPGGHADYTVSVTERSADQVNLNIHFSSGLNATQTFSCSDGDLRATGYVDFASAAAGQRATVETRRAEGVVIPRDVRVGSDWNTKFEIVMHSTDPRLQQAGMGELNGTVSVHHHVLSEESVTVPAGVFTALKVQTETNLDFTNASGAPLGMGAAAPVVSTEWWVRGKGMVKTVSGSGSVNAEATEINVP